MQCNKNEFTYFSVVCKHKFCEKCADKLSNCLRCGYKISKKDLY